MSLRIVTTEFAISVMELTKSFNASRVVQLVYYAVQRWKHIFR